MRGAMPPTPKIPASLMAAARAASRYGHGDATMILIGRHGLRASELCDLQWSQVELATSRLHVRRGKRGTPNTTAPSFDSRAQKALHTKPGMVGLLQRWSDTPSPRDIRRHPVGPMERLPVCLCFR